MPNIFHVGDVVRRTRGNAIGIVEGHEYTVTAVLAGSDEIQVNGGSGRYDVSRFMLVRRGFTGVTPQPPTLPEIWAVGVTVRIVNNVSGIGAHNIGKLTRIRSNQGLQERNPYVDLELGYSMYLNDLQIIGPMMRFKDATNFRSFVLSGGANVASS